MPNPMLHSLLTIQWNWMTKMERKQSQIIQPKKVIGVLMGVHHFVNE
jgi:hypothetical protein